MPILDMSETALQQALTHYEALFSRGDVEGILEDFADDVRVHYASFAPFVGKDKLGALLRKRFATMRDYRLKKRLEFVQAPRYAASWTGTWTDVASGEPMQLFGLEMLTVQNGKFTEWTASVSVWRRGEAPSI